MIPKSLLALVSVTFGLAPALPAQDRATLVELEVFRNHIGGFVNPASLTRLIQELQLQARHQPEDRAAGLRVGLAMLRHAAVTDGRLFSKVRDHFRRIAELEPGWPYPEFGVGLAELERGDWLAENPVELGNRVGYGSYRGAIAAFSAALQKDPGFEAPAISLAYLARRLRDSAMVSQAIQILGRVADSDSVGSEVLLLTGRLQRDFEFHNAALAMFRRAGQHPANRDRANLEIAKTLLALGVPGADSLYYASAASSDPVIIGQLRQDLAPIAEESELSQYDRLNGSDRTALLYRFWLQRDRYELRTPGERLAEHYRRLYYARHHFALQINRRYYTAADMFRNLAADLDDRGVVYLRQGEPDERIMTPMFALNGNETWVYHQPGGDLVLHFGAGGLGHQGGASDDYRLVHSILDLWRPGAASDMLIQSRASIAPVYDRMMAWGPYGQAHAIAEEREVVERSAETAVTTDGYQLRYQQPLDAAAEVLVIGPPEETQLHLVFAVRDSARREELTRVRLALFDENGSQVSFVDSSMAVAEFGHVTLPVSRGRWLYRLALERGNRGKLFQTDVVPVTNLSRFGLSDLALAEPPNGVAWEAAPGDSVYLSPYQVFRPDHRFEVYYEVYGLAAGEAYETTVAVLDRRELREGRQRLHLSFNERSSGATNRLHRTVGLNGLKKGDYWLILRVRNASGQERLVRKAFKINN